MNQEIKNKLQWIDDRMKEMISDEYPHPEAIDFLLAERDRITTQILKEEFSKMDWEAQQKS